MNLLNNNTNQYKPDDKVTRNVEKACDSEESSPMDPPEAYAPPKLDTIPYAELHPFLQGLSDEHRIIEKELEAFEEVIIAIHEQGMNRECNDKLCEFFRTLDELLTEHSHKEDSKLFPALQPRLLEEGEHSTGATCCSAIDQLEDDHSKIHQLTAVTFNIFGLSARLPDPRSQIVALDVALNKGKELVELLRLHFFREENILFPLAQKYLSKEVFSKLA